MSKNLKPCPFCGSSAKVIKENTKYSPPCYSVECTNGCSYVAAFYSSGEAIEAWNSRVTTGPAVSKVIETLQAAKSGLEWYRTTYLKSSSEADDEMLLQIDNVLRELEQHEE